MDKMENEARGSKRKRISLRVLSILLLLTLATMFFLLVLSKLLANERLISVSLILLIAAFFFSSLHSLLKRIYAPIKRVWLNALAISLIIVCAISTLTCLSLSYIKHGEASKLWERVEYLYEQRQDCEYGSSEYAEIDEQLQSSRSSYHDLAFKARNLALIAQALKLAEFFVTISQKDSSRVRGKD